MKNTPSSKTSKFVRKQSGGFGLIELLLVVSVLLVLSAIAFGYYTQYTKRNNVKLVTEAVPIINACIQERFGNYRDYDGLNNSLILKGTCIPENLKAASGEITNPWANDGVTVASMSSNDRYYIRYTDIPEDECVDIANKLNPQSAQFEELRINSSVINNPTQVNTQCSGTNNQLEWRNR